MKQFLQRFWNLLSPPEVRAAKQRVIAHAQQTYPSYHRLSARCVRSDSEKIMFRVDYRGPVKTRPAMFLVYEWRREQRTIRELDRDEARQYVHFGK